MEERTDHIDVRQPLIGPCLNNCGNQVSYWAIIDGRELYRWTCPKCGKGRATEDDLEENGII